MSRFIEVTHTYVVEVNEMEADDPSFDSVCNSGVSMMEAHMKSMFSTSREIRSDWKLMPREYQPGEHRTQGRVPEMTNYDRELAKHEIEHDLDGGISFTRDVMGQDPQGPGHPWDQGLFIFPADHPLRGEEERLRRLRDKEGLRRLQELPPGE